MDVHHHPHVEKKRFKEYFFEFLMIFLAVTMGFIAENIREHFSETKTAHHYLESYRNDLLQNQKYFKSYDSLFTSSQPLYDSIISILYEKKENIELPALSRLLYIGQRNIIITINTSTYQQMVSSGSMRYLHNQKLIDSIAKYNDMVTHLINYNDRIVTTEDNNFGEAGKLIDIHDFWNNKKMKDGDQYSYQPDMQPLSLAGEERRFLITYYKIYAVQAFANPFALKRLYAANESLIKMINKELGEE